MAALKADSLKNDTDVTKKYTRAIIIDSYDGKKDDVEEQKRYRNRIIAVFMDAIDENYHHYSNRLFNEGAQFGLGFEGSIVGLAATSALFPNSAPELASVIAAAGGAQATVNKNLYFDRTLPALITTMDARRIEIDVEITKKKKLTTADYPIEAALRDLRRYQTVGTLFRAVADVTSNAAQDKEAAEDKYEAELGYSCVTDGSLDTEFVKLRNHIRSIAKPATQENDIAAQQKLRTLAILLKADSTAPIDQVLRSLLDAYDQNICTKEEWEGLKQ
ncbi:MAG: hypothetical protein GW808_03075 [Sphingomonadales bacterium]|nr:hypothetical protein [Sphingomonadales bacterium]NCO98617.1 hypothetical protein [Sphingomonadales bacterium]NCQ08153.1 hypothetical protein [Sphingomonadales bacterium]NCQ50132.1 hypothetical protein [Sphingomonadales bacterium]